MCSWALGFASIFKLLTACYQALNGQRISKLSPWTFDSSLLKIQPHCLRHLYSTHLTEQCKESAETCIDNLRVRFKSTGSGLYYAPRRFCVPVYAHLAWAIQPRTAVKPTQSVERAPISELSSTYIERNSEFYKMVGNPTVFCWWLEEKLSQRKWLYGDCFWPINFMGIVLPC